MAQQPVTAKQFADDFYKFAGDPDPRYAGFHEMADTLAAKHPEGVSDQQLWQELAAHPKYGQAIAGSYRLVPSADAPAAVATLPPPESPAARAHRYTYEMPLMPAWAMGDPSKTLRSTLEQKHAEEAKQGQPNAWRRFINPIAEEAAGVADFMASPIGAAGMLAGPVTDAAAASLMERGLPRVAKVVQMAPRAVTTGFGVVQGGEALKTAGDFIQYPSWDKAGRFVGQAGVAIPMLADSARLKGHEETPLEGRLADVRKSGQVRTAPPPTPIDISKLIDISGTVAASMSPPAEAAFSLLTKDLILNPKLKASPTGIAKDLGIDKVKGGRIYSELRQAGKIGPDGSVIGAKATAPPPAAKVVGPVQPPASVVAPTEQPPVVSPAEAAAVQQAFAEPPPAAAAPPAPLTPDQQIAANEARITELQRLMGKPAAQPMVSRPTAESPASAAKPVEPAFTAPAPQTTPPPEMSAGRTPEPQAAAAPTSDSIAAKVAAMKAEMAANVEDFKAAAPKPAVTPEEADAAAARIAEWGKRFIAGDTGTQYYDWRRPAQPGEQPPEQILQDLKTIGRHVFDTAGQRFGDWKDAMVSKFGPWVEAHLMPVWLQLTTSGDARPGAGLQPPESVPVEGTALPPSPPPTIRLTADGPEIPVTPDMLARFQAPKASPSAPLRVGLPPAYIGADTSPLPGEGDAGRIAAAIAAQGGTQRPRVLQMPIDYSSPFGERVPPGGPPDPDLRAKALLDENRPSRPELPDEQVAALIEQAKAAGATNAEAQRVAQQVQDHILRSRSGTPQVVGTSAPPSLGALPAVSLSEPTAAERSNFSKMDRQAMLDPAVAAGRDPLKPIPESAMPQQNIYPLEQALRSTGFQERDLTTRFQGVERPHVGGKAGVPRKPIARPLPSGNIPDRVFVKPVAGGAIDLQWDSNTHEFEATKYDARHGAPDYTIRGVGPNEMVDFLNHVRQVEKPVPTSQMAGRSTKGTTYTPSAMAAPAPVAAASTPAQEMDNAAYNIMKRTTAAPPEDIPTIIAHAILRAAGKEPVAPAPTGTPTLPPQEYAQLSMQEKIARAAAGLKLNPNAPELRTPGGTSDKPGPEQNARDVATFTGGTNFEPAIRDQVARVIANAVVAKRAQLGLPETATPPGKIDVSTKDKRTPMPAESPFTVAPMTEGTWLVTAKEGGETNVFINKVKTNRYEVKIGTKTMRATSSVTAAKFEAIKLAEAQLYKEAEKNTPVHVQGVGTYAPLGEFSFPDAEGDPVQRMMYQFLPEGASKPVQHSMAMDRWEHVRTTGTPVNPFTPPQGKVGRPANTQAPPVKITATPPEMGVADKARLSANEARIAELERAITERNLPQQ